MNYKEYLVLRSGLSTPMKNRQHFEMLDTLPDGNTRTCAAEESSQAPASSSLCCGGGDSADEGLVGPSTIRRLLLLLPSPEHTADSEDKFFSRLPGGTGEDCS